MQAQLRVPGLDLIRFIAAFAVMAFHYAYQGGVRGDYVDLYDAGWGAVAKYGYLGVDVFFVISGLVIAWSAQGSAAGSFLWKRWLRIYPTFMFAVLVTAAVCLVAGDPRFTVTGEQVLAHLFVDARRLGQNFLDGSYWTIVVELTFYVMVAIGLRFPVLRRNAYGLLWAWLLISIANEYVVKSFSVHHYAISEYAGLFIMGIMLYAMRSKSIDLPKALLFGVALVYSLEREVHSAALRFAARNTEWSAALVVLIVLGSLLLLIACLFISVRPAVGRWLTFIGGLTYPLYLLHQTIGYIVINKIAGATGLGLAIAATVLGMVLLSALVARYVEPFMKSCLQRGKARLLALSVRAGQT